MLQKKLWLAGAVGAVCFAISASVAQDQTQRSATQERGVTVISRTGAGSSDQTPDARRYQRSRTIRADATPRSTAIRNYHKALFGTEPARQSAEADQPQPVSGRSPRTTGIAPKLVEVPVQQVVPADYSSSDSIEPIEQVSVEAATPVLNDLEAVSSQPVQTAPSVTQLPAPNAIASQSALEPDTGAIRKHFVTNSQGGTPQIETVWRKKGEIHVGQECHLELIVRNTGEATASFIEISTDFPKSVRVVDASPRPFDDGTWKIPQMVPGKEHTIDITLVPHVRGEVAANANVQFTSAATTAFTVEEPMLALALSGPEQVTLGEPASHLVTISNPGTGIAHDVSVMVTVPEGLQHASQRSRLAMELGSLSPGEKRNVRLSLTAIGGGSQSIIVDARAGTNLTQQSKTAVEVLTPQLAVAVEGPALRYLGRDARYSVSVSNKGAATTDNVRAMYAVPEGFEFQSASRGGKYDAERRIVSWFVGSVKASESVDLSLKLRPSQLGRFTHAARVVSEYGDIAEAQSETRIEGTASLLLKVADLDDPVETGRETAYEISIQNDGSKEALNVGLSIELPVGVSLIDVKGPSIHSPQPGGLVVFKPLAAVPAGKTATYRVFVKGMEEGNQRLRARLTSDSIQEPLTVEELTRYYAD